MFKNTAKLIQGIFKFLKSMPLSLQSMCLIYFVTLVSYLVLGSFTSYWSSEISEDFLELSLDVFTYGIGPFLLLTAILSRNLFVVPLYFAHCMVLFIYSFEIFFPVGIWFTVLRFILFTVMLVGGMIILHEDHVFALLSPLKRPWRKNKRVAVESMVQVAQHDSSMFSSVILKNYTHDGMSFSGFGSTFMAQYQDGDYISFKLKIKNKVFLVNADVKTSFIRKEHFYLGVQSSDSTVMQNIIKHLGVEQQNEEFFNRILRGAFKKSEVRKFVVTVWTLSTGTSLLVPSCGERGNFSHAEDSIRIPFTMGYEPGFYLVGPVSDFQVTVSGCLSGFQKTYQQFETNEIRIPRGDKYCQVFLDKIDHQGEVYYPTDEFNPELGASTEFISDENKISVIVTETLSETIVENEKITFKIAASERGEEVNIVGPVSTKVSLQAAQTVLSESDQEVVLALNRDSFLEYRIHVNLNISGSAVAGVDYQQLPQMITIPANEKSVSLPIRVINDELKESEETLIISLAPGVGYYGSDSKTFVIKDDDFGLPEEFLVYRLMADAGVELSGESVTALRDQVQSFDAVQNKSRNYPNYRRYPFPAVDYGNKKFLKIAKDKEVSVDSHKTFVFVMSTYENVVSRQVIYELGDDIKGFVVYIEGSKLYVGKFDNNNKEFLSTEVLTNSHYIFAASFDQDANFAKLYKNSLLVDEIQYLAEPTNKSSSIGLGVNLGNTYYANSGSSKTSNFFTGGVSEILMYNQVLAEDSIMSVSNFLTAKYDLSRPVVSIYSVNQSVSEDSDDVNLFKVVLDEAQNSDVTVKLKVSGNATSGVDYKLASNTVTISPGQIEALVPVVVVDDGQEEEIEEISLNINSNSSYYVGDSQAKVSILDNEKFTPVDSLILWYFDKMSTTRDDEVKRWFDKSKYQHHGLQSTASLRPVLFRAALDDNDSIKFDGKNDVLQIRSTSEINKVAHKNKTHVIAFRTGENVVSPQMLWHQGTSSVGFNIFIEDSKLYTVGIKDSNVETFFVVDVQAEGLYYLVFIHDGDGNRCRAFINSVLINDSMNCSGIPAHSGNISIGKLRGRTRSFDGSVLNTGMAYSGEVFEVMQYNSALSLTELKSLHNYLRKFGAD